MYLGGTSLYDPPPGYPPPMFLPRACISRQEWVSEGCRPLEKNLPVEQNFNTLFHGESEKVR